MRIAVVVPGGVDRSGKERVIPCLLWLIERLARDHEVHVFALHQEEQPGRWDLLGATVYNAGRRPRRLRALAQLYREHRRAGFDVVHGFWAAGPGVIAAIFGRLTGVPSVVTLPGGDLVALPEIGYGGRLTMRGRLWTRFALAVCNQVTVPSRSIADLAKQLGVRTDHIPLGVAIDRWPERPPAHRDPATRLRLLHVANLNQVKDQAMLLEAMKSLRARGLDFHLNIIGLDCLSGTIQRRCEDYDLSDQVTFHGFVAHDRMRRWFEQADLLVMSSRHEAGPLVMAEAAIVGVPTIGTAVGQIADWAPGAAVAVPVGDFEALADAILSLAQDEGQRLALAREAQRLAVAQDADFTARASLRLYRQVIGG